MTCSPPLLSPFSFFKLKVDDLLVSLSSSILAAPPPPADYGYERWWGLGLPKKARPLGRSTRICFHVSGVDFARRAVFGLGFWKNSVCHKPGDRFF